LVDLDLGLVHDPDFDSALDHDLDHDLDLDPDLRNFTVLTLQL
jgi:hypothetical protein